MFSIRHISRHRQEVSDVRLTSREVRARTHHSQNITCSVITNTCRPSAQTYSCRQCGRCFAITPFRMQFSSVRPKLHYTDTGYEHHQRTSSQQFYNLLYNKFTTNGQKYATSQHLDMSRCWALALRCGKFVIELL